jgi:pimeloyl-ACP methyl ester carboxylesterase
MTRPARRLIVVLRPLGWLVVAAGLAIASSWSILHRRSAAVRQWRESTLTLRRIGRMTARTGGSGSTAVLLLHGLVATGDVFGQTPDDLAATHRVAVPDLLGFGRSLDEDSTAFATVDHLAAIDAVVEGLCSEMPLAIGAHSMGSGLALRYAAAHPGRVRRVVCVGAPMWRSPEAARDAIGAAGPMARAFLLDEAVAERICRFNCGHRTLSGLIAAVAAPRWLAPVARQTSLHTWSAYHQAIIDQVIEVDWKALLARLDDFGIQVCLVWGAEDSIGDIEYARELGERFANLDIMRIARADHTLPTAQPDLLVGLLQSDPE